MVETLDAVAAHGAVPASTCSNRGAVWAQLSAVDYVEHIHEID